MGDVLVRHNTWILCWQIEPGDGTRRARCGVSTWAVQIAKSSSACIVRGKGHIILDLIDPAVDVHVLRVFVRRSDSHSGDASQFDANISDSVGLFQGRKCIARGDDSAIPNCVVTQSTTTPANALCRMQHPPADQ
jgi:hypothetical protein